MCSLPYISAIRHLASTAGELSFGAQPSLFPAGLLYPRCEIFAMALRVNFLSGLYFSELPSLRRRHWKPWIHRRLRRNRHRRRRPTGPAPSSRRHLLQAFYHNYFSRRVAVYAADRYTVRENRTVTVRTRGTATSPFKTNYRVLLDHRLSPALLSLLRGCQDATDSGLERLTVPFEDHP